LGKKVRFWTGASVADNADYVMVHREGKRRFSMTMKISTWSKRQGGVGYPRNELTGVHIVREVFRGVFRCSGGGSTHVWQ
jgi:hypothetical protein